MPVYDEYPDDLEEQCSKSTPLEFLNTEPMHDSYRSELLEGSKEKLLELSSKSSSSPNNGQHITKIIEPIVVSLKVKEQLDLIDQLHIFHVIQDPMAIYIEKKNLKYSNVAALGIKSDCNNKYNFSMEFLI